jgi:hypothetical protein
MSVTKRKINGEAVWVIDRRFRGRAGEERYRRAAQVQTKVAGEAEERRIISYWEGHGTIKPLLVQIVVKHSVQMDYLQHMNDDRKATNLGDDHRNQR